MKTLSRFGDRRSHPRWPRSLPSPISLSHRPGVDQGSSEGRSIPGTAVPGGCGAGQEVAALAPRLGPRFLFRCGWDFPALAVGPRSAPAAALFSISKAAEADGFNATAISSVPKAGGPPPPPPPRTGAHPPGARGLRARVVAEPTGTRHHLCALRRHTRQRVGGYSNSSYIFRAWIEALSSLPYFVLKK